jgi:hypothetical protein
MHPINRDTVDLDHNEAEKLGISVGDQIRYVAD